MCIDAKVPRRPSALVASDSTEERKHPASVKKEAARNAISRRRGTRGLPFFFSIFAPEGLNGIEPYLSDCQIPLKPYHSHHNGHVILRAKESASVRWSMDPSETAVQTASGEVLLEESAAEELLRSLSKALAGAGFPHQILLDDQAGNLHAKFELRWRANTVP